MADFCRACGLSIFGEDFGELAGITQVAVWQKGKAMSVICEGCGPIQVDPDGNCVSRDCMEEGKPGHGMPWVEQGDS